MPRHEPICSPFPKFSSLCNFPLLSNQTLYNQMSLVERVICYRGLLIIRMTSNHLTSCCSICICTKTCQHEGNNRATLIDIKTIMEPPREWHQANWKKWRGNWLVGPLGEGLLINTGHLTACLLASFPQDSTSELRKTLCADKRPTPDYWS